MTVAINNSVGSNIANAYASLASSSLLLEPQIQIFSTWSTLATTDQAMCIIYGTSLLDYQVQWAGTKSSESQSLRWPREGVVGVDGFAIADNIHPTWLQDATANYAYFLSQKNRTAEDATKGFKKLKAGSLFMEIDKYDRTGTMPSIVWNMIKAYGIRMNSIARTLERK